MVSAQLMTCCEKIEEFKDFESLLGRVQSTSKGSVKGWDMAWHGSEAFSNDVRPGFGTSTAAGSGMDGLGIPWGVESPKKGGFKGCVEDSFSQSHG